MRAPPLSAVVLRHWERVKREDDLLFPSLTYARIRLEAKRVFNDPQVATKSLRRGAATALRQAMSEEEAMLVTGHRKREVFRYYVEGPAADTMAALRKAQGVLQGPPPPRSTNPPSHSS